MVAYSGDGGKRKRSGNTWGKCQGIANAISKPMYLLVLIFRAVDLRYLCPAGFCIAFFPWPKGVALYQSLKKSVSFDHFFQNAGNIQRLEKKLMFYGLV